MDSVLFSKARMAGLVLKNRIMMSAAASWASTPEGDIDLSRRIIHFEAAEGGCGLIINGGVGGVHLSGRRAHDSPLFDTDGRIASHRRFTDKIHEGGAAAAFQATHSGTGAAKYQKSIGAKPFVPSFVCGKSGDYRSPDREECPAAEGEISRVISAYGDAALRARKAGYDAIEVHAAHESLLAQWLSPVTNRRKDGWGGCVENRCRIHREILKDMKDKAGRDFPVIIKLGVQDGFGGGLVLDDGLEAAEIIARQGNADAIEISQGLGAPIVSLADFQNTCMKPGITTIEKEAYFRDWTKKVKAVAQGRALVIMQGGLRTPALMEEIIQKGEADLVSMCRPYIREPGLVKRWMGGDWSRAACVSCNKCILAHNARDQALECQLDARKSG